MTPASKQSCTFLDLYLMNRGMQSEIMLLKNLLHDHPSREISSEMKKLSTEAYELGKTVENYLNMSLAQQKGGRLTDLIEQVRAVETRIFSLRDEYHKYKSEHPRH